MPSRPTSSSEISLRAEDTGVQFLPDELCNDVPENIQKDVVLVNVGNNLVSGASKSMRSSFLPILDCAIALRLYADGMWYCVLRDFHAGHETDLLEKLYNRMSTNFVSLLESIPSSSRDSFVEIFVDAMAQVVFFYLFLAFPKNRTSLDLQYRVSLVDRFGFWIAGIVPDIAKVRHWKLVISGTIIIPALYENSELSTNDPEFCSSYGAMNSISKNSVGAASIEQGVFAVALSRSQTRTVQLKNSGFVSRYLSLQRHSGDVSKDKLESASSTVIRGEKLKLTPAGSIIGLCMKRSTGSSKRLTSFLRGQESRQCDLARNPTFPLWSA